MLVLSRRMGQEFTITCPDGTKITIINLGYNRVGIEAPIEYSIERDDAKKKYREPDYDAEQPE